ncbi:MAG: hypothetical protein BIP78_0114 [Candidatus Bipolaricaulis sibiricus]|uniref:4Fe-4S ferredoxin-type domain-containing protein n=1 Tax=Bipolaricaulis sibiricus TaxID=2501609 RepID=A0A410FSC1_BIPS1|nr:MAG: hypothetical protein BIP78_0114 [Candidatus Bipolaricaulis sibiricus]
MRTRVLIALALFVAAGGGVAQSFGGFGEEPAFGPPAEARDYGQAQTEAGPRFFIHRQEVKLALLGAFMVGAGFLAFLGRPWLRRVYLVVAVAVLGFFMGGFLCPTAAVQNVFLKAGTAYLLLFLVPVVGALALGRLFCGYVCPFGALQELLHVRKWALKVPDRVWRALGWVRHVVLVYLVARVLVVHTVAFDGFSPFKPLFAWGGTPATIVFSALFAVLSVVVFRPFCRVLCPYGALLSIVSRFSLFHIEAGEGCRDCGLCTRACPVGAMHGGAVDATECLLCGTCTGVCRPTALKLHPLWRRR